MFYKGLGKLPYARNSDSRDYRITDIGQNDIKILIRERKTVLVIGPIDYYGYGSTFMENLQPHEIHCRKYEVIDGITRK